MKKKFTDMIGDFASELGKLGNEKQNEEANNKINEFADEATKLLGEAFVKTKDVIKDASSKTSDKTKEFLHKSKDAYNAASDKVVNTLDQTGDGKVEIDDLIIMGLKVPGIHVDRASFLKNELFKYYPQETIDKAIAITPAKANVDSEIIDKIADEVIQFERVCVSGISTLLGTGGGFTAAATIPADIAQYYGYMLRAAQKLLYLYGFPEIDLDENAQTIDTETINLLIVCLGVMYGVAGARNALLSIATALGHGVKTQLMKKALTKGTLYPIIKSIAKWFNVRMTKEIFSSFFEKAIPVVGGVIGGGLTYLSFKPCCDKLKDSLKDTLLSNPNTLTTSSEELIEIIDVEVTENNDK